MDLIDAYTPGETSARIVQRNPTIPVHQNVSRSSDDGDSSEALKALLLSYNQANYPMNNKHRGIAYLVNVMDFANDERRIGSEVDAEKMKKVLQALRFQVIEPKNTKRKGIFDEAENSEWFESKIQVQNKSSPPTVASMDHSDHDCFVLVIMTHGTDGGQLAASDYYFYAKLLFENFVSENCKTLMGKPKLFFVQACRGENFDRGRMGKRASEIDAHSNADSFITVLSTVDQLYSTPEGFVSWRNSEEGAWFIQELSDQLETNFDDDLMTLLTSVCRRVAIRELKRTKSKLKHLKGAKQMPIVVSSLTKKIFLRNQPVDDKPVVAMS